MSRATTQRTVEVEAACGRTTGLGHDALVAGLVARYAPPHWLLLPKVADASGFDGSRTIDAVAFGLYGSRGYELHAFEAKASRGDLLRELKDPEKADAFATVADRFYIVAPGPTVARPEDLPANWGLLYVEPWGSGVRVRTARAVGAAVRRRVDSGPPLPRPLVAAMLTRLQKRADKAEAALAVAGTPVLDSTSYDQGYQAGLDEQRVRREQDRLRESVEAFEREAGVRINPHGATLGQEFRAFRAARSALRVAGAFRVGVAEQRAREAVLDAQTAVEALVALRAAMLAAGQTLEVPE